MISYQNTSCTTYQVVIFLGSGAEFSVEIQQGNYGENRRSSATSSLQKRRQRPERLAPQEKVSCTFRGHLYSVLRTVFGAWSESLRHCTGVLYGIN